MREKATILHAEHQRPPELPIRDRFARHYADFEALGRHPSRADAMAQLDRLDDVVRHKSRFFSSAWAPLRERQARHVQARAPPTRHAALARDYATMKPMFLEAQIELDVLMQRLEAAEHQINGTVPLKLT